MGRVSRNHAAGARARKKKVAPRMGRVSRNCGFVVAAIPSSIAPCMGYMSRMNVSYVSTSDLMPRMEYAKEWSKIWY